MVFFVWASSIWSNLTCAFLIQKIFELLKKIMKGKNIKFNWSLKEGGKEGRDDDSPWFLKAIDLPSSVMTQFRVSWASGERTGHCGWVGFGIDAQDGQQRCNYPAGRRKSRSKFMCWSVATVIPGSVCVCVCWAMAEDVLPLEALNVHPAGSYDYYCCCLLLQTLGHQTLAVHTFNQPWHVTHTRKLWRHIEQITVLF